MEPRNKNELANFSEELFKNLIGFEPSEQVTIIKGTLSNLKLTYEDKQSRLNNEADYLATIIKDISAMLD